MLNRPYSYFIFWFFSVTFVFLPVAFNSSFLSFYYFLHSIFSISFLLNYFPFYTTFYKEAFQFSSIFSLFLFPTSFSLLSFGFYCILRCIVSSLFSLSSTSTIILSSFSLLVHFTQLHCRM
jgi:hypothetical protein